MYFNLLYLKAESFDLMRENGLLKNMQESVTHFNKKPSFLTHFFFLLYLFWTIMSHTCSVLLIYLCIHLGF